MIYWIYTKIFQTETQINDLFWFEFDTICQWLGYKDEDDFLNKRG